MSRHWLFIGIAAMFFAAPRIGAGQSKQGVRPTTPTTRTGVYNEEQASRGSDVYLNSCKQCHTADSHTGAAFRNAWNGKKLSDLFIYMRDKMPKNDPGSLSEQEYVDVLAYVLKLNKMPAGKTELPPDATKLSVIRIVTTQSSSTREK